MKILYGKSMWEMEGAPLAAFLERTRAAGFDAAEINLASLAVDAGEAVALHREFGLEHISQLVLEGDGPDAQLRFLEQWFPVAAKHVPLHVNLHTGRDFFPFGGNLALFERAAELSAEFGIPVTHETHRGRALYSAVETRKYLEAFPEIRLNADFSHWMVVHESDLSDQAETMALAIRHSRYIHARVGYEQGPQVPDPRAPEWRAHLDNHLGFWRRIIDACRAAEQPHLVITPEFGPPDYMHTLPFTNAPVADTWDVNVAMLELLKTALAG